MVLDASAVLALLNAEPGWERVAEVLPAGIMSAVNLAEVVGKLVDHGMPGDEIREVLSGLGLTIVPFDDDAAAAAGELRSVKGGKRLALGDRACLELGRSRSLPVMTADRYWSRVDTGVELVVIR
ncbi:MAG: type II toxin-antitoxin system VapC family toxin [Acidobacteriota bacterium]|jgi:PIN domain nuclease of toxin-antitoxin system